MKKSHRSVALFRRGPDIAPLEKDKNPTDTAIALQWCAAWCKRWFTPVALLPVPAITLLTLYALIAQESPARYLLLTVLTLAAAAAAAAWIFRPALEIRRKIPPRAGAGEEFQICYEVKNRSRWRSCYDVRLDPYPFSSDLEILESPRISRLAPGKSATFTGRYRQKKRGVLHCYRPLAETAFPFGIVKGSCRSGPEQEMIFYPAFHPLRECPDPAGAMRRNTGSTQEIRIGDSPEFLGCREYRAGDDVRRIDWRGSARRTVPVVREFEEERYRKIALIVDTALSEPAKKWFPLPELLQFFCGNFFRKEVISPLEAELSLAMAAGESLLRHKVALGTICSGNAICRMNEKTQPHLHQLCDLLGAAEADPEGLPAPDPLLRALEDTDGALLFLLRDDPERRKLAAALTNAGIALEVIVISAASAPLPAHWRAVSPAEILNGRVERL